MRQLRGRQPALLPRRLHPWTFLLLVVLVPFQASESVCPNSGSALVTARGGAALGPSLTPPVTWTSATVISGSSAAAQWAFNGSQPVTISTGASVLFSCVTLASTPLTAPSLAAFGQPTALQLAGPAAGAQAAITLQDVTLQTGCDSVMAHQAYICRLSTTLLAGTVEISSPNWLFVHSWLSSSVSLTRVNITCTPPPPPPAAAAQQPACLAAAVRDGASLLAAVQRLQRQQGPPLSQTLPVLILVQNDVKLSEGDVSPFWPGGLDVTANVTIAAGSINDRVVFDFSNLLNVFNVRHGAGVHLTLGGFVMINLPTAYIAPSNGAGGDLTILPPVIPISIILDHLYSILETFVSPVHRTLNTDLTTVDCTYVLPYSLFSYYGFWGSLSASSLPDVSKLTIWSKVHPKVSSDPNRLPLEDAVGSHVYVNATYANPSVHALTVNDSGILAVSDDDGVQAYIPAVALYAVKSVTDILYGVNLTSNYFWTKQFGQTMLFFSNVSGTIPSDQTHSTLYPAPKYAAASTIALPMSSPLLAVAETGGGVFGDDAYRSSALPSAPPPPPPFRAAQLALNGTVTPAVLQVPTEMTTFPGTLACWDLRHIPLLLTLTGTAPLTLRLLSVMNLPWAVNATTATPADPTMRLASGFWNFPQRAAAGSFSTSSSSFLLLQNVTIYVPPTELQLFFDAATLSPPDAPTDTLTLSAQGRILMYNYIAQQQIASYGSTWIFYSTLQTTRFTGTNVNLTSAVPPACSDYAALPLPTGAFYGAFTTATPAAGARHARSIPGWAIGVIAGVGGAAVLAAALLALRSLRRRGRRAAGGAKQQEGSTGIRGASSSQVFLSSSQVLLSMDLGSARPSTSTGGPSGRLDGAGKLLPIMINSFSGSHTSRVSGPNMIDNLSIQPVNTPGGRATPEALINQIAYQNTGMKDEQLQIFGVLGRGGHGVVYRGLWKGLPVAAKVMIVHEERQEQSRRQMLEATLSTSLSHPNIVNTYSYELKRMVMAHGSNLSRSFHPREGSGDGTPNNGSPREGFAGATTWQLLIVQELCSGGAMRQMIDSNSLMCDEVDDAGTREPNLQHVLLLALDVAMGLRHLHSKNVVHSDMTPNNVLLQAALEPREAGLQWVAKVADFGLSVAFEDGKSHASKVFAGTPYYIAPETQYEGILSKACDVFAFGILLSEMVTGFVPKKPPSRIMPYNPTYLPEPSPRASPKAQAALPNLAEVHAVAAAVAAAAAPMAAATSETEASTTCDPPSCGGSDADVSSRSSLPTLSPPLTPPLTPAHAAASGAASLMASSDLDSVLHGGCGGSYGFSRALPLLPFTCPPHYCALVADCLNPAALRRPTIGGVCRRLRLLAKEHVCGYAGGGVKEGEEGGAGAERLRNPALSNEQLRMMRRGGSTRANLERAQIILEGDSVKEAGEAGSEWA